MNVPKVTQFPRLRSHVRKNKAGRVRVHYYYDMRPEGKPDLPLGSEFEEALAKWRELHEHKPRAKGRLAEAIIRWREEELPQYTNDETKRSYARQLARVEAVLGQMAWEEVTLPLLREYLDRRVSRTKGDKKRIAKTQGNREMSVLSIVWGRARLWGMTALPWPAAGVKNWKHEEAPRAFEVTDDLFAAVYASAEPMLRDCMDIATATGMRLTDCRTVRLPSGDMLRLKASKTGKAADFDLSVSEVLPDLMKRRRAIPAAHVMLLSTVDGFPVTASMLRGAWDRARALAAGKNSHLAGPIGKMYLRDMRKRASDLADDMEEASAMLQHGNTRTTERHYRARVVKLRPVR